MSQQFRIRVCMPLVRVAILQCDLSSLLCFVVVVFVYRDYVETMDRS